MWLMWLMWLMGRRILRGLWCNMRLLWHNRRLLYHAFWMILFILPAIVTRGSLLWLIWLIWLLWLLSFVSHYICSIPPA